MPLVSLFYDLQNKCLVRGFNNSIQTSFPNSFQGDTLSLFMRFMNPTGNAAVPYVDADESAALVQAAIGTIGGVPSAGTFTITDVAATQVTAAIAWNASAATVQAAIQAALLTNWSMATVTGAAGGPWIVTNGANAGLPALTVQGAALIPASQGTVDIQAPGSGSSPAIQYIKLQLSPIAYQGTWASYPAPTITVANVQTGGVGMPASNSIQSIVLNNQPYNGTFTITFGGQTTAPLSYNAAPSQVQTALQALSTIGSGNCTVGGSLGTFQITFIGTMGGLAQPAFTTNADGLIGPLALTGTFSLNTVGIEEAVGESQSITQTFEVKITPAGGSPQTVLQAPVQIFNDLIPNAPAIPTPGPTYILVGTAAGGALTGTYPNPGVIKIGPANAITPTFAAGSVSGHFFMAFYNVSTNLQVCFGEGTPSNGDAVASTNAIWTDATTGTSYKTTNSGTTWTAITVSATPAPSLIKSGAYTAIAYDEIEVDTSAGAVTITLPASPAIGARVKFGDAKGTWGTNNLTIARNALLINGTAGNYVASVTGNKLTATYISSGYGWSIK